MEVLEVGVRIPLAVVAQVNLGKPHPALDQPPRGQEPSAVNGGFLAVDAVEALGFASLGLEVENLGNGLLHPIGQFIRLDSGAKLVVLWVFNRGEGVHPVDQAELVRLFPGENAVGPVAIR